MKVSPVATSANTVGAISGSDPQTGRIQAARTLRMNTNATPGREEAQAETPPPAVIDPKLTNPDSNSEVKAEAEATQPLDPQLAALAKQKRALQVKEREIADREKALEGRSAVLADAISKAGLKSDPLRYLQDAGVTYDQLTEAILANQGSNGPEIQALKAEIKALKEGVDKTFTERDTQAEKQVLAEMTRDATRMAETGEEFEMVREAKAIPSVIAFIEKTYRTTGEVVDVKEAMQLFEDDFIEQALKMTALNKVKNKLAAPAQADAQPQQQRPAMRTLTNRDTAQVPQSRKARALAAFRGELKK